MRKLITILLLAPCILNAQVDKAIDEKIDSKLATVVANIESKIIKSTGDTLGVISSVTVAGTFNVDTIKVKVNTGAWFDLFLSGSSARAIKRIYITNTNGLYKVVSNTNTVAFTGLTGASWDVVIANNLAVVKIVGTAAKTDWKLTRLNL